MIAVTGADMAPKLDGAPVPHLADVAGHAQDRCSSWPAPEPEARTYVAISGGIDTPPVLGSRSTFHMAGVGGVDGYALKAGQHIAARRARRTPTSARSSRTAARPSPRARMARSRCMLGPNDSWLDEATIERFLSSDWTRTVEEQPHRHAADRAGIHLLRQRATNKRPEHGQDPSNILDHGYPLGAINLAGQTPIILVHDAPSTGGFINPFTVPSAAFWKLGQVRPNEILHFRRVSMDQAHEMRRSLDAACTSASLTRA